MTAGILFNWAIVFCTPLFLLGLLNRSRVYATWAKVSYLLIAIIGPVTGLIQLGVDSERWTFAENISRGISSSLSCGRGFLLGLMAALALSGELLGKKDKELKKPSEPETTSRRG